MERRSRERRQVQPVLAGATPATPVEALVVHREALIRVLKHECAELHAHRQGIAGTSGEPELVQRITYWENVLEWVKEQYVEHMIMMTRKQSVKAEE